jgi:hypothetical protein
MIARVVPLIAVLAAVLVLPAAASASVSGTNTFTGSSIFNPSDWNDSSNWSQGEVPDGADDVVIPAGKFVSLTSGAVGVAKTLSLAGTLTVDGGGVVDGRSLTLGSGTTTISNSLNVWNGAVLNLGSTTNWTAGAVGLGGTGGGTVNIAADEVVNVIGDLSSPNYGGGLWNNQGTINRTTGTGTASFNNAIENDGAINVGSGKLSLSQGDGVGTSSGDFSAAAGATLDFYGGTYELVGAAASVAGAGTVEVYGSTVVVGAGVTFDPGALGLTGYGTLQLDTPGTTGSLNATGGTRSGSGTLTVNGAMSVGSSVFKGGGTTTVAGTTHISAVQFNVLDGHTLNLGPTTNWSAGVVGVGGSGGATVNIGSGDVLNVTGDVSSGNFGSGLWNNQGTINRTTATGTASFNNAVENDGTINAGSGTLTLAQGDGAGTSSGDYIAAAGATLSFGGGTHELTDGAALTGAGTVRFGAGTTVVGTGTTFSPEALSFIDGTLQLDTAGSAGSLTATAGGGTRNGSGTLSVSGAVNVSQIFTLKGSGTTSIGGTTTLGGGALYALDGHTLNLGPTTNWSAGIVGVGGSGDATVNIGAGDVLNVTGNVNTQGSGGGHWNNEGTINRVTSSGTANFFKPVTSSGAINVHTGTLSFDSGLTQTSGVTAIDAGTTLGGAIALEGGVLKGAGSASGSVTNTGGTVAPGASPGKLSIGGNYAQSAGTLEAEVAGTGQGSTYDWLAVGGNVAINGGTLAIVTDPLFDPALTDTFDIVTAGATHTVAGTGFSAVTGAQLAGKAYAVQTVAGPPGKVTLAFSSAPLNTTPPSLPTAAHVGDTISCDPGAWSGSPSSFEFQWLRDGSVIPGATASNYVVTSDDVGTSITCRVTATSNAGSADAESSALVPTASPTPTPTPTPSPTPSPAPSSPPAPSGPSPTPPPSSSPGSTSQSDGQTVRGDMAFSQGTSNDLYLACTKLDLLLIDVLPAGARAVSVTGAADLRLVGRTAEILLDGERVGTALIGGDGSFAAKVRAPAKKRRKNARYEARIGATASQRLKLTRRMVTTTLTRSGSHLLLRGTITGPLASRPAAIAVERYLSCRRRERVEVVKVVPDRAGTFAVKIPLPAGAKAAIYRALTKVPPRLGASATARTFTLPRAIDV